MPSQLCEADADRVKQVAREAFGRLGMRNGWVHIELKRSDHGVVVIEAAARMGGGYFGEMIERIYGVDRMRCLIDIHLGRDIPMLPPPCGTVVGRRIVMNGIHWVRGISRKGARLLEGPGVQLIWPNSNGTLRRLVIGPPHGFKNTVLEFFTSDESAAVAYRRSGDIAAGIRIRSIPLPAVCVRLLARPDRGLDA